MKKIMIIFICTFFIAIISCNLIAQIISTPTQFLITCPDARACGMGYTGTAIADNIDAVFWNPAGLGFLKETNLFDITKSAYFQGSFNYFILHNSLAENTDNIYWNTACGYYLKPLDGVIFISGTYRSLGDFVRTDDEGHVLGVFNTNEYSIGIGYGTSIGKTIGAGGQLKYIQSNLSRMSGIGGVGSGLGASFAVDLGFMWRPEFSIDEINFLPKNFFSFGVNLQNIGSNLNYMNEDIPLPTTLRIGTAFTFINNNNHNLRLAVDCSKLLVHTSGQIDTTYDSTQHKWNTRYSSTNDNLPKSFLTAWKNPGGFQWSLGMEYRFKGIASLRCGYYYNPTDLFNRGLFSLGGSVRIYIFQADLSYNITPNSYTDQYRLNPYDKIIRLSFSVGGL